MFHMVILWFNNGAYKGITDHDNENAFYPPDVYKK